MLLCGDMAVAACSLSDNICHRTMHPQGDRDP